LGKKVGLKDIVANEDLAPQESIFTGETTDDYRAAQESEVFLPVKTGRNRLTEPLFLIKNMVRFNRISVN